MQSLRRINVDSALKDFAVNFALVYSIATTLIQPVQENSVRTQLLIRAILMSDLDSGKLRKKLEMYGFLKSQLICTSLKEVRDSLSHFVYSLNPLDGRKFGGPDWFRDQRRLQRQSGRG